MKKDLGGILTLSAILLSLLAAGTAQPGDSLAALVPAAAGEAEIEIQRPRFVLAGVPFELELTGAGPGAPLAADESGAASAASPRSWQVDLPDTSCRAEVRAGEKVGLRLLVHHRGPFEIRLSHGAASRILVMRALPGWLSLAPPLVAIGLALWFRQVVVSLLLGVWVGAFIMEGAHPLTAALRSLDHYLLGALAGDSSHMTIILFSLLLGGMVGVMSRAAGVRGLIALVKPLATSGRRVQLATWLMGLLVFFDDYANTLIVGTTARPLTDRLRVSREKLAFIVDATAAPVASLAVISTWVGFEVGLIGDAFATLGLQRDAYSAFVASIPYRFYPLLALFLGFMVALTGRDFGPMGKAERRAKSEGKLVRTGGRPLADFEQEGLVPPPDAPARWVNALLPIGTVIAVTLAGLWATGRASAQPGAGIREILSSADSLAALLWASAAGGGVALLLAIGQRILPLGEAVEAWMAGIRSLLPAAIIMTLAWGIGGVCREIGTADYLYGLLRGELPSYWVPTLTFLVAALMSFATGTSWGTMAVLMPLAIPLGYRLGGGSEIILLGTLSGVLAGSVFGDHCSPISDTTILSSMASSCDHLDHVRTQLPYAIVVGLVSTTVGDLLSALGVPPWLCLLAGAGVLLLILFAVGRGTPIAPEGVKT